MEKTWSQACSLMMTSKRIWAVVFWLLAVAIHANGQTDVTTRYQIGGGVTKILDTYLSQEKFSGPGLTFLTSSERQKPNKLWATMVQHELNFSSTEDRVGTVSELQGDYTFFYGRYRKWEFSRLTLQAGAIGALNLGFIYNTSNSNNPAQGRLSLNAMPMARSTYYFEISKEDAVAKRNRDIMNGSTFFVLYY